MTEHTSTPLHVPAEPAAASADDTLDAVFARLLQNVPRLEEKVAEERLRGDLQLAELMTRPRQERLEQVFTNPALHHVGFVDVCCIRVQALLAGRPKSALLVSELALYGAWAVRNAPEERRSDLRARAFRVAAETMARCGMLREALVFLSDAQVLLDAGGNDPLEQAALLEVRARRERDLGEEADARRLLEEARRAYRRLADCAGVGRTLLAEARLDGVHDPAAAAELCQQALALFDATTDVALVARARLQLGWHLNDAGRSREALLLLASSGHWLANLRKPDRLRYLWLEGRIALRLGLAEEAAGGLGRAVAGWRSLRRLRAFALASVDHAEALFAIERRLEASEALLDACELLEKKKCLADAGVDRWVQVAEAVAEGEAVEAAAFRELRIGVEQGWFLAGWKSAIPPDPQADGDGGASR
jgi:hypothetical protein